MKTVLFLGLMFGALALTSCKKDYECEVTVSSGEETYSETADYPDLNKSDAEDAEKACEDAGGTWSEK